MHRLHFKLAAAASAAAVALSGCASGPVTANVVAEPAELAKVTPVQRDLIYLPPPPQPVPIAVYNFNDQTGQLKPSENIQSLSRAVTQGGTSVLIKALRDAGNGNWFTVVERERLDNLLKERQIIREMRQRYLGEQETPAGVLPSLLFAGILLEGGIVGYDTNVRTGGVGARMLAIGASTQYRQNNVTVYLRAISVKTGEVLANVVTSKSVASVAVDANVFKFVEFDELLEFEAGLSSNEPTQIAVQAAIEKAVYALIMEGAQPGRRQLWSFYDQAAGDAALARYADEKARAWAAAWRRGEQLPAPANAPPPQAAAPTPVRKAAAEAPAIVPVARPAVAVAQAEAPAPAPARAAAPAALTASATPADSASAAVATSAMQDKLSLDSLIANTVAAPVATAPIPTASADRASDSAL